MASITTGVRQQILHVPLKQASIYLSQLLEAISAIEVYSFSIFLMYKKTLPEVGKENLINRVPSNFPIFSHHVFGFVESGVG